MKNSNNSKRTVYVIGILLVLACVALLVGAILSSDFSLKEALLGKLRADTIYIALVFMLLLPLLLLLLAMSIKSETKRKSKKPQVIKVASVALN